MSYDIEQNTAWNLLLWNSYFIEKWLMYIHLHDLSGFVFTEGFAVSDTWQAVRHGKIDIALSAKPWTENKPAYPSLR